MFHHVLYSPAETLLPLSSPSLSPQTCPPPSLPFNLLFRNAFLIPFTFVTSSHLLMSRLHPHPGKDEISVSKTFVVSSVNFSHVPSTFTQLSSSWLRYTSTSKSLFSLTHQHHASLPICIITPQSSCVCSGHGQRNERRVPPEVQRASGHGQRLHGRRGAESSEVAVLLLWKVGHGG